MIFAALFPLCASTRSDGMPARLARLCPRDVLGAGRPCRGCKILKIERDGAIIAIKERELYFLPHANRFLQFLLELF